jgi:16S rRNA (guanine966-N2)-methyltransferase
MRIISGKYKGFVIRPEAGIPARPTTDRAKESLFNILENGYGIEGKRVLDLFSGTGNMAFEFASRGASEVYAVDLSRKAVSFIGETFRLLDYSRYKVFKSNAFSFLKESEEKFDIIFADPPYAMPNLREIAAAVFRKELLNPGGTLIVEHASRVDLGTPELADKRVYGQSTFSFFRKKD